MFVKSITLYSFYEVLGWNQLLKVDSVWNGSTQLQENSWYLLDAEVAALIKKFSTNHITLGAAIFQSVAEV